jgi:hypothetical protein
VSAINSPDSLKMVREALCLAETWLQGVHDTGQAEEARGTLQRLIADIDRQRPLGPDGKHGDRHTPTCGCEDVGGELRLRVDPSGEPLLRPDDVVSIMNGDGGIVARFRVLVPLDSTVRVVRVDPADEVKGDKR